jgi:hypothetical protein
MIAELVNWGHGVFPNLELLAVRRFGLRKKHGKDMSKDGSAGWYRLK